MSANTKQMHNMPKQGKRNRKLEEIKYSPGINDLNMGSTMAFSGLMPSKCMEAQSESRSWSAEKGSRLEITPNNYLKEEWKVLCLSLSPLL
jgi:hypothetical protein